MTDSALSSLYPTVQIGSDGFNWWIGQIESVKETDKKGGDRWKVRIIGLHPKTCDEVDSEDLPWATAMMPVTNPHTPGGIVSVSNQLDDGCWVVGFFLDTEKQQPVIMGSIGRVPASKSDADADPTPGVGCNSFTTFLDPEKKKPFEQPIDDDDDNNNSSTESGHVSNETTKFIVAKDGKASLLNQAGTNVCVEVADPCGKDSDLSKTMTRLFSEMLYETQRNNGKLGDYLVGEVAGDLYDASRVARKYTNKAIKVIRSFIAKIKGHVVDMIKKGVKMLTNALLRPSDSGNSLTPVTKFFNDMLKKVGCEMADLGDRLAEWLTEIIFGYLFNIYKTAVCQVDKFVGGILSKIQSLMESLLSKILGPLQSLLGAIAKPLNMIGDAINYVLKLLGISCSGPKNECAKVTKVCSKGDTDNRKDFLDNLLDGIENMSDAPPDWNQYTCDDAYQGTTLSDTEVTFVGGVQEPKFRPSINYTIADLRVTEGDIAEFVVTRTGYTDVASSVTYSTRNGTATADVDYQEDSGILGFAPGETEKTIEIRTYRDDVEENLDEDFFMRIRKDTPQEGSKVKSTTTKNIARCLITEARYEEEGITGSTGTGVNVNPNFPNVNPEREDLFEDLPVSNAPTGTTITTVDGVVTITNEDGTSTSQQATRNYSVTADKQIVRESEFITYTITTENVPNGSRLRYTLFGVGITPEDIVGNTMTDAFEIEDNTATVVIGISQDNLNEDNESLIFAIDGTSARVSVLIESDAASLTEEELFRRDDSSSSPLIPTEDPKLPIVGDIITDDDGGIIYVPIVDPGDPYREPPNVFITGEGTRSSAVPLLDTKGYLTEIRITDPGYDYKLNTSVTAKTECIIDSFTLIRPGQEYKSTPTVYVNGDSTIAEAVVEDNRVISVRIKNRSMTFKSHPEVRIIGGGGYGAKVIASIVCLDPETRVKIGSAKIGTGSYIDCP